MKLMLKILDIIIPRFITEDLALIVIGKELWVLGRVVDIQPGETYNAVGTAKAFNFFGFGLFARITNIREVNA